MLNTFHSFSGRFTKVGKVPTLVRRATEASEPLDMEPEEWCKGIQRLQLNPALAVRLLKFSLFRPVWCHGHGPFPRCEIRKENAIKFLLGVGEQPLAYKGLMSKSTQQYYMLLTGMNEIIMLKKFKQRTHHHHASIIAAI